MVPAGEGMRPLSWRRSSEYRSGMVVSRLKISMIMKIYFIVNDIHSHGTAWNISSWYSYPVSRYDSYIFVRAKDISFSSILLKIYMYTETDIYCVHSSFIVMLVKAVFQMDAIFRRGWKLHSGAYIYTLWIIPVKESFLEMFESVWSLSPHRFRQVSKCFRFAQIQLLHK